MPLATASRHALPGGSAFCATRTVARPPARPPVSGPDFRTPVSGSDFRCGLSGDAVVWVHCRIGLFEAEVFQCQTVGIAPVLHLLELLEARQCTNDFTVQCDALPHQGGGSEIWDARSEPLSSSSVWLPVSWILSDQS